MTQAERFVRNICEAHRRRLNHEKEAAEGAITRDEIPMSVLPTDVRRALAAWNKLQPTLKASKVLIEKAGYQMPSCGEPQEGLSLGYRTVEKMKEQKTRGFRVRYDKVEALQSAANIAILGVTMPAAQAMLKKLQADLDSV